MNKTIKVSEDTWKKLKLLSLDKGKTIAKLIEEYVNGK